MLNGPAVKKILEQEFGVSYSLWGVYRLLHRLGFSCLCPRLQHEKADSQAQEELTKTSLKHRMLDRIANIYIGVGDRENPVAGSSGKVVIDEIMLDGE